MTTETFLSSTMGTMIVKLAVSQRSVESNWQAYHHFQHRIVTERHLLSFCKLTDNWLQKPHDPMILLYCLAWQIKCCKLSHVQLSHTSPVNCELWRTPLLHHRCIVTIELSLQDPLTWEEPNFCEKLALLVWLPIQPKSFQNNVGKKVISSQGENEPNMSTVQHIDSTSNRASWYNKSSFEVC